MESACHILAFCERSLVFSPEATWAERQSNMDVGWIEPGPLAKRGLAQEQGLHFLRQVACWYIQFT